MSNLVHFAIPVFVLSMIVEALVTRRRGGARGYGLRDTATSLSLGIGNVVIQLGWKGIAFGVYAVLHELTPLRLPADQWWTWVLLFFAEDLCYYGYHRSHHEVRLLWASHVPHHSSQHYNFSTALRQTWTPMTGLPFWAPLALAGFEPWAILVQQSVNLLYQFTVHTELVRKLPRPIEWIMNTPSHHRVHHGSNPQYLDRNHGGILIVWDRLFGTFCEEGEPVVYGLTKNIETSNPLVAATHEYAAIARDAAKAGSWRIGFARIFRGPGWQPV